MSSAFRLVVVVLFGSLLLGCQTPGPATPIAQAVATGVAGTLTSQPVATAYPTSLPPATQLPLASNTPLPSATPRPTQPAPPSATPYPKQTAWPTQTATATPTVTQTPAPNSQQLPPPPASLDDQLLSVLLTTLGDVRLFRQLIADGFHSGDADCPRIMATFNRVANAPTFDVSAGSPEAQYAHAVYRDGVTRFSGNSSEEYTGGAFAAYETCVHHGDSTLLTAKQNSDAGLAAGQADALLVQGILRLGGEV